MNKRFINFVKAKGKRKQLETLKNLFVQYGMRGTVKGISNKVKGYPLLEGLSNDVNNIGRTRYEYDVIGKSIFEEQQKELSAEKMLTTIKCFKVRPKISIIMPLYNSPVKWLKLAIESIINQTYINWELCLVDDGSKDLRGISLVEDFKKKDARIKLFVAPKNEGIACASNKALEMATGEFIALVDQDDELTKDALFWLVRYINYYPNGDLFYSDECKTGDTVEPSPTEFYFKPDWSPELLLSHMYIGHFTAYRTSIVNKMGGFRGEFDFSQDYDLALRVTQQTKNIYHIERVLYYWRMIETSGASGGKDFARISNVNALKRNFSEQGVNAECILLAHSNYAKINRTSNTLVSIIIPSDSIYNLRRSIDGLIGVNTAYTNLEIILVTNSKTATEVLELYPYLSNLSVCYYDKLYNFSDKCNQGVKMAQGEYVIIYNDDVYPNTTDWIERMFDTMLLEGVGGVSPLMLYENDTVQYAGMITGVPGQVGTSFNGLPAKRVEPIPLHHFAVRNVSILSGACMMMRKDVFQEIGGFDATNTPTGHSDVDISFKILERNLRCVYNPNAILTHIGNHSWDSKSAQDKAEIFCLKKWGQYLARDPYFTDSMRRAYYHDQTGNYSITVPNNVFTSKNKKYKDILFVFHELTLSGAPMMLLELIKLTMRAGNVPVAISSSDGPMRAMLTDLGVSVIVDEGVKSGSSLFEHFARNFDLVIVNTLVNTEVIRCLSGELCPVVWWIHEGIEALKSVEKRVPRKLGANIHAFSASEYSQRLILDKFGDAYRSEILRCAVEEEPQSKKTNDLTIENKSCTVFMLVGALENRKGQDILLRAIDKLPKEYMKKSFFHIIGRPLDSKMVMIIKEYEMKYPNIIVMGEVKHDDLLEMYKHCTAVIVPSRDEPTSLIAIEAMVRGKLAIVSDKTGVSEILTNGKDGLIFANENELTEILKQVIDRPLWGGKIGEYSRLTYEKYYTVRNLGEKFQKIVENLAGK